MTFIKVDDKVIAVVMVASSVLDEAIYKMGEKM
jgi:hypothetical protein